MGVAALFFAGHVAAYPPPPPTEADMKRAEKGKWVYSPYPDQKFPNRVYWGAAHNHTSYSFDSGMFGITLTPEDLFRFAMGGVVVVDNGVRAKIDRPLDWLSVTDHAEYLGLAEEIANGSPELLADPTGKKWYEASRKSPEDGVKAAIEAVVSIKNGVPAIKSDNLAKAAWSRAVAAAEK
jgi:hypothetical protein